MRINKYTPQISKKPVDEVRREPEQPKQSRVDQDSKQNSSAGYEHKTAVDYKTGKVNIGQILVDFRNTLVAIGAPKEIEEEVKGYLNLVDMQSQKPKPSSNIIKSNLKNAAEILDDYITKTLNKPSKVVLNWVDALLLQNVDFSSQAKTVEKVQVEPEFEQKAENVFLQKPEQTINENITQVVTEEQAQPQPLKEPAKLESIKLKKLYRQSERLVDSGNFEKALLGLEKTLKLAKKYDDKNIETKAHMDIAYIHDLNNDLPLALESYNNAANSAKTVGDKHTQAKAHYNMATIYDDVGKVDVALEHYYSALALDGETENLQGQALTLNSIGNMFAVKNDHKAALNYYKLAFGLAKEQNDNIGKASILSNVAGVFRDLGMDKKALNYYKDAIKYDIDAGNAPGYAKSYEQAGDIMLKNNQMEKAKNLYKKSMIAAQQIGDRSWSARMMDKMEKVA